MPAMHSFKDVFLRLLTLDSNGDVLDAVPVIWANTDTGMVCVTSNGVGNLDEYPIRSNMRLGYLVANGAAVFPAVHAAMLTGDGSGLKSPNELRVKLLLRMCMRPKTAGNTGLMRLETTLRVLPTLLPDCVLLLVDCRAIYLPQWCFDECVAHTKRIQESN